MRSKGHKFEIVPPIKADVLDRWTELFSANWTKEDPPKVALDEEEKKTKFLKAHLPDLTPSEMSASFPQFSAPDKDEGFDEIKHMWNKSDKCVEYLKQWVLHHKTTTRVIAPLWHQGTIDPRAPQKEKKEGLFWQMLKSTS